MIVQEVPRQRPLPQDAAQRIEAWVRGGRYLPGSQLPPERELSIRLGTSRNVLREALRILETRGLIQIRHGVGSFVAEQVAVERGEIPVQVRLQAARLPIDDVTIARRAIECAVVEVAARVRDEVDLERLRSVLDETVRCVEARDSDRYVELDLGFHELLGACTHNRLLSDIQGELTRATMSVRSIATGTYDAMRSAVRFHGEILDALVRRDAEAARAVMLVHLLDAADRLLGRAREEVLEGVAMTNGRDAKETE